MLRTIATTVTLACLLVAGCANSDYFEPQPLSSREKAQVFLYRPAASNPGKKPLRTSYPELLVDGKSAGLLKYNQRMAIELDPGNREFVATGLTRDARWEPRDVTYKLNVEAGQTYYMRLRVEFNTDKMSIGSFKGQYNIHLHLVDEDEAVYEIRHTNPAS
jgi:hypothetical protein